MNIVIILFFYKIISTYFFDGVDNFGRVKNRLDKLRTDVNSFGRSSPHYVTAHEKRFQRIVSEENCKLVHSLSFPFAE